MRRPSVSLLLQLFAFAFVVMHTKEAAADVGHFGNALHVSDTDKYIEVAGFGAIAPTTEVTVEFWVLETNPDGSGGTPWYGSGPLFRLSPDSGSNRFSCDPSYTNGNTYWDFGDISTGAGRLFQASAPGSFGAWTHYALVASQSGNFMRLFVNGALHASKVGMSPFTRGTYALRIGNVGEVDEFRVWNVARTSADILANYRGTLGGSEAGLLLYYRLDETTGRIAHNSATATGSAFDGAIIKAFLVHSGAGGPQPEILVEQPAGFSLNRVPANGLAAWGDNEAGQTIIPGEVGVIAIAASVDSEFTLGLKADGTVFSFGCGEGNLTSPSCGYSPATYLPTGLTGVISIAAGYQHGAAAKSDGTVVTWGNIGTVPTGLSGVTAVAAGTGFTVALKNDGTVFAWGQNNYGQCNVPAGLSGVTAISAQGGTVVALKNDGTVVAWGNNSNGQCNVPGGLTDVKAISLGGYFTLALKNDGTVVLWGGGLGVPGGLTGVTGIAAGEGHALACKKDGTVVAWGSNLQGQCDVPAGLTGVVAVSAGDSYSVALQKLPAAVAYQTTVGADVTQVFTIKNVGATPLILNNVTRAGGDAAYFSVDATGMSASVNPGSSTPFSVTYHPVGSGPRATTVHISNNDGDESELDIALSAFGYSFATDADADGMNDASEFLMATLGFDWQVSQPQLVQTYYNNANGAGLFNQTQYDANRTAGRNDVIAAPNTYDLYTLAQVQSLNVGVPLLQKNGTTGGFMLTIGIKKAANLSLPFANFPMNATGSSTVVNAQGQLEFRFSVPDNAAFFRLESQ